MLIFVWPQYMLGGNRGGAAGNTVASEIKKLYSHPTYFSRYGVEFFVSMGIVLLFIGLTMRLVVYSHASTLKATWPVHRCDPKYMPFAGLINGGDAASQKEYTEKNLAYCAQNTLKEVSSYATAKLVYATGLAHDVSHELGTAMGAIRQEGSVVRNAIGNITETISGNIQNVAATMMSDSIILKNQFARIKAILGTSVMGLEPAVSVLQSVFTFALTLVEDVMVILAALIIVFWAIPFVGWPLAIADTAIMVAILVVWLILEVLNGAMFGHWMPPPPLVPHCFPAGTPVDMLEGTCPIEKIRLGDVLADGSRVTGRMVSSSRGQKLFDIDGTVVTGEHRMEWNGRLIQARSHPSAIEVEDFREPHLYCINSLSKRIYIKGKEFVDWDDLDLREIAELSKVTESRGLGKLNAYTVHDYLEAGLGGEMLVDLDDGRSVRLSEIRVNDVLRFGQTVTGVVVIDASDLDRVREWDLDDGTFLSTDNICFREGKGHPSCTYDLTGQRTRQTVLHHLVTDTGSFVVNGVAVGDYNTGLEDYLRQDKTR